MWMQGLGRAVQQGSVMHFSLCTRADTSRQGPTGLDLGFSASLCSAGKEAGGPEGGLPGVGYRRLLLVAAVAASLS